MGRTLRISTLAALAALAAACGGSSGSSSGAAKLASNDVAVVGQTHITKSELDHQIEQQVAALKVKKQKVPAVGTASYTSTIVQPTLAYLVTDAQVHNIAKQLKVSVTSKQVQDQITKAIQQFYGGSQAKYQADLKRYDLTPADVAANFELQLLEQKIETKVKNQVKVTTKDVQDYYTSHKSQYATAADTRTVDYVLLPSKSLAEKALSTLSSGKSFGAVSSGAIDDSSLHEPFTATKGQIDKAFEDAAFSLKTNQLSGLVPVDKAYATSSLKGKCKPTCYFIIRPTSDTVKGGTQKSFASVEAQIKSQLLSTRQTSHLTKVVNALETQQKKITKYAPGYAPPKTSVPSTNSGGGTATAPAT
jgi:parvulin-like peptidyl-prolyl isomerase